MNSIQSKPVSDSQIDSTYSTTHQEIPSWLNHLKDLQGGVIHLNGVVKGTLGQPNILVTDQLHCTITVHDMNFFRLMLQQGSLGAAESYLRAEWDVDNLVILIRIMVRNRHRLDKVDNAFFARVSQAMLRVWYAKNKNNKDGSKRNIAAHYDLSNDFFKLFLDNNLMYSSAVFESPDESLEDASNRKLAIICDRLNLSAKDHVIEIGTGWGGFAIYAALHYGCRVTTTTISKAQYDEACARVNAAGLSHKIHVIMQDYRELTGKYDKLVSIEMIEAVGHQFLSQYFSTCQNLLKPNGLGLIQAITIEDTRYKIALNSVDFIKRYIFPGSFIPCNSLMINTAAAQGLKLKHLQDIGQSYALTLHEWRKRFHAAIPQVLNMGFDQRFVRMWDFYLCYCEGGFIEGAISDVHLLFENSMAAE
ncbi:MAG: class I SAM-dependent methyltransferase [Candidatus Saccharibacteria bacterium]|nr:class I SAM-dependent methyltransferase [Moraxellaceae bacterium]